LTTASGDIWRVGSDASGNWRVYGIQKADGTALVAAAGGMTDTERRNTQIDRVWNSKLSAAFRKVINGFGTGFTAPTDANNAILTVSSSGYAVTTNPGYVQATSAGGATVQINASSATQVAAQNNTIVSRDVAIPNGTVVGKIGMYSVTARSITVKIALRNAAGNYTIVVSQAYSHTGTGWEDVTLTTPYTVPGTGTYYCAVFCGTAVNPNVTGTNVSRAYLGGDQTGTITMTEDSGVATAFSLRYTTAVIANSMTLVSSAFPTDASVSVARCLFEYDATNVPVLGTDITLELTCNGGTNWTSATIQSITAYGPGNRAIAETTETTCTAGTSFQYRLKSMNKVIPFWGIAVNVR
jgi:hypothetical protein